MPLSEDEQRILRQMEEQLQRDPGFARTTRVTEEGSRRGFGLSLAGMVVALLATVLALPISPFVAFALFLGAVVLGVMAEHHARRLAKAGLENIQQNVREKLHAPRRHRPPQSG